MLLATLVLLAVPGLVAYFAAQYLFGVELKWFPVSGVLEGFPRSYLLPALVIGVLGFAGLARLMRTSIVETVNADFVKTARAKGMGEQRVLWSHILPNALLPIVTFIGIDLAGMFGGAIITESIFNLPGLGQFMFQAIKLKEGGVVVLLSTLAFISFIVINLLVDVAVRRPGPEGAQCLRSRRLSAPRRRNSATAGRLSNRELLRALLRKPQFVVCSLLLLLFFLMAAVPKLFTSVDPRFCELTRAGRAGARVTCSVSTSRAATTSPT